MALLPQSHLIFPLFPAELLVNWSTMSMPTTLSPRTRFRLPQFEDIVSSSEGGGDDAFEGTLLGSDFVLDPSAGRIPVTSAGSTGGSGLRRLPSTTRTPTQVKIDAIQTRIDSSSDILTALLRKEAKPQYSAHLEAHRRQVTAYFPSSSKTQEYDSTVTEQLSFVYWSANYDRPELVAYLRDIALGYNEHLDTVEVAMSYLDRHVLSRASRSGHLLDGNGDCTSTTKKKIFKANGYTYTAYRECPHTELFLHALAALHLAIKTHSPQAGDPTLHKHQIEYHDVIEEAMNDPRVNARDVDHHLRAKLRLYDRGHLESSSSSFRPRALAHYSEEQYKELLDLAEQNLLDDLNFYLHPSTSYGIAAEMIKIILGRVQLDRIALHEKKMKHGGGHEEDVVVERKMNRLSDATQDTNYQASSSSPSAHEPPIFDEEALIELTNVQLDMAQDESTLLSFPKFILARAAVANSLHSMARSMPPGTTSESTARIEAVDGHVRAISQVVEAANNVGQAEAKNMYTCAMNLLCKHLRRYEDVRRRQAVQEAMLMSTGVKHYHQHDQEAEVMTSPAPQQTAYRAYSPQSVADCDGAVYTDDTGAVYTADGIKSDHVKTNKVDITNKVDSHSSKKQGGGEDQSEASRALRGLPKKVKKAVTRSIPSGRPVARHSSKKKRRVSGCGSVSSDAGSTPRPAGRRSRSRSRGRTRGRTRGLSIFK